MTAVHRCDCSQCGAHKHLARADCRFEFPSSLLRHSEGCCPNFRHRDYRNSFGAETTGYDSHAVAGQRRTALAGWLAELDGFCGGVLCSGSAEDVGMRDAAGFTNHGVFTSIEFFVLSTSFWRVLAQLASNISHATFRSYDFTSPPTDDFTSIWSGVSVSTATGFSERGGR